MSVCQQLPFPLRRYRQHCACLTAVTIWQPGCFSASSMEAHVNPTKLAPARMHHFIADQLNDLSVRGTVLSVLVQESAYLVTLSLADRGIAFRQLSPFDVSRSLRGDPDALAVIRADLLRDVSIGASLTIHRP